MEGLSADNVKIYGISYDSEAHLKAFADQNRVTYDLLSDEDSAVIKQFGILNTLVDPENDQINPMTKKGFYGMPFPGVYVTDESGVVTEKFFYRHYATRASAGSIINSALANVLMPKESPRESASTDRISMTAFLADESLKFEYRSQVYVRLNLEDGLHIYGGDLPAGFIATTVRVPETPGVRVGEAVYPDTTPKRFEALDVTLNVYKGVVDIAIPVSLTAEVMNWTNPNKPKSIEIPVEVNYQLCSETVCYPPQTKVLTVTAPVSPLHMPGMRRK